MTNELEYATHRIEVFPLDNNGFTMVKISSKNQIYEYIRDEAIDISLSIGGQYLVAIERALLYRFMSSLVSFCSDFENKYVYLFDNETSYYSFCVIHDIKFEEQSWFRTFFIRGGASFSISLCINISVKLQETLFPSYRRSVDIFKKIEEDRLAVEAIYKPGYKKYLEKIKGIGIDCLYHFSDQRNSQSIEDNGILSMQELQKRRILPAYASSSASRSIDSYNNIHDYVHLSFERNNPMIYTALKEGRLGKYKIYEINPIVLFLKDTIYTNGNSAAKNTIFSGDMDFLIKLPFDKFHRKNFLDLEKSDKQSYMSEVLVKEYVDKKYIL